MMQEISNSHPNSKQGGYIALTAALLIMAIIVVVIFSVGTISFLSRDTLGAAHFKEKSIALAEGCLQVAYLRLAEDSAYVGGETVPIDSDTCQIISIVPGTSTKTISVRASSGGAYTNFKVTIRNGNFNLIDWEEVPSF